MEERYLNLLKTWCDRLLDFQIDGVERLDGAILCPACMTIHGRCQDLIYPLLCLADRTGEERYLTAARRLFVWGGSLVCDDGSFYNDAQSSWNGITVFAAIVLCESLEQHGHLLDEETREAFECRMKAAGHWIYENLTMDFVTNINYHATTAAAMALLGNYEDREDYRERAREMAASCLKHITADGLFYGEGKPMEAVSRRGCRPVDIGYNVEESLPALLQYARAMKDEEALIRVKEVLLHHLEFMLPDGGWDNSFGTRNFKWTYWGSRTSEGCQTAYGVWGSEEPVFAEAAYRNLCLYEACTTRDGLLAGGPDYERFGEAACVHHAFCHSKALAAALDAGIGSWEREQLPSEKAQALQYYPTIDTYKVAQGDWLATVTGYDVEYCKGGHATGGTLSLLWNKGWGPVIAAGMTDYSLYEAHNMQQVQRKHMHRSLVPRLEWKNESAVYAQCYDDEAQVTAEPLNAEEPGVRMRVRGCLRDIRHQEPPVSMPYQITFQFTPEGVKIRIQMEQPGKPVHFLLPLIAPHSALCMEEPMRLGWRKGGETVVLQTTNPVHAAAPVFNLVGGFEAWECEIPLDKDGRLECSVCCSALPEGRSKIK
ncbi:MAG: hypothetical protein PHV18_02730 [Lachnospiraceae bacterium]|nr:hypothetical protein [Lachnospiraceae bacterium]